MRGPQDLDLEKLKADIGLKQTTVSTEYAMVSPIRQGQVSKHSKKNSALSVESLNHSQASLPLQCFDPNQSPVFRYSMSTEDIQKTLL